MNKRIKLLSLISVLAIGTTMTFSACGKDEVAEHDHQWSEGTVTTAPTCHSEGVTTYTCSFEGCTQTKTTPIAMTAHTWNSGEVTTQATCSKKGVKTFTCTVEGCGGKKEEEIDKTPHRYDEGEVTKAPDFLTKGKKTFTCLDCEDKKEEAVGARADFAEQFYTDLTKQSDWLYGYANSYDVQTGSVDFVRLDQTEGDAWKNDNTKIGKGYVYSENNAVVAYKFAREIPEKVQTDVAVTFSGEESTTCLNAYLIISNNGALKDAVELNGEHEKDWSYSTEEAFDITQGDTFYLVFENIGTGKAGGNLAFTLTAPCVHVWNDGTVTLEPTETNNGVKTYTCINCEETKTESIPRLGDGADFRDDFTLENQDGAWSYGKMDDPWSDNRHFVQSTEKTSDAWKANGGDVEIKAGWINAKSETTIAYTAQKAMSAKVKVEFEGSGQNTLLAIRLYAADANGKLVEKGFNNTKSDNGKQVIEIDYNFKAAETIYVMFSNEKWDDATSNPNGSLDVTVTPKQQDAPDTEFTGASFRDDFTAENQNGAWSYGYVDYSWEGGESFEFHKSDRFEDGAWKAEGVQIKSDWIDAGGMTTIAYTAPMAININAVVDFVGGTDGTRLAVRIGVKNSEGVLYAAPSYDDNGKESKHLHVQKPYELKAGDTIYFIFSDEAKQEGCWPNGALDIKLNPVFGGASLRDDFTTENQDGAWNYGYVDYSWEGGESFEFHKAVTFEDGAWKAEGVQIKSDWIDAGRMATISYKTDEDLKVKATVAFVGGTDGTRLAVRIGVKNSQGVLYAAPSYDDNGKVNNHLDVEKTYELKAGDTIYFIFSNEANQDGCWPNGELNITITNAD